MGSPTLVRILLREDLVDELRLMITPVVLGGSKTQDLMSALIENAAMVVAPAGVASTVAVSVTMMRTRRRIGRQARGLSALEQRCREAEVNAAARDCEAVHLAEA